MGNIRQDEPTLISCADNWVLLTNNVAFPKPKALLCTGAGDATLIDDAGNELPLVGLTVSPEPLKFRPVKLKTGTAATLYGLY